MVLNYDDPVTRDMANRAKARVVWFSSREVVPYGAFVLNGEIVFGSENAHTTICRADEVFIPGPHNLENALAAVTIAGAMVVAPALMAPVLRTFRGVEHRIETVRELDGVTFINDSKGTNVDSTQKAIATMTRPTVLILGGSDKGASFDPLAETIIAAPQIVHCVLIGDTAEKIKAALDKAGYTATTMAGYDFDLCLRLCREKAPEGGCVLLSPALSLIHI